MSVERFDRTAASIAASALCFPPETTCIGRRLTGVAVQLPSRAERGEKDFSVQLAIGLESDPPVVSRLNAAAELRPADWPDEPLPSRAPVRMDRRTQRWPWFEAGWSVVWQCLLATGSPLNGLSTAGMSCDSGGDADRGGKQAFNG